MTTYDPTAYRRYFEREFTYLAGFRRNTRRYPDHVALHDPARGLTLSYAELGAKVDRLATGLADAGVGAGDVVVYQLYNSVEFALLYLATQVCGAVGSPINFRLAPGETASVLDDSEPAAFIYDGELAEQAGAALAQAKHTPVLLAAVGGADLLPGAVRFEDVFAETPRQVPGTQTAYDETTRLYTSGTTGMPKGVPLNSLVEIFSAHDVIMHFPLSPEDRTLNMTPWFHRGGLYSGGPNPAFYLGAQVVPMRTFDPERVLDLVQESGLTYLIGSPTNLAMLAGVQSERPRDLSSLRGIVTMGTPLEREACLRYQEVLSTRIFNGYGTTEAFWNTSPEQEKARFHAGWLYIGDLATWDREEFVTIVGRKDDMIVSGGENVHPVQVEEALNEHPNIADSLVVAVPDDKCGQRVVAYVVPATDSLTAADCERHCREHPRLADYKRPRAYRFVDPAELPLTATSKKIHYKARDKATTDYADGLFEIAAAVAG